MKVVEIKRNKSTIEKAHKLLADCESGEVVAFTVIAEHKDGKYATDGTSVTSRLQMSGALLEAALVRLGVETK